MYMETNKKEPIIDTDRITISEYLRVFLAELAIKEMCEIKINSRSQAERIKSLINIPKNTVFKSLAGFRSSIPYWHEQEVDFVPSNLGKNKGFIFYFICNSCGKLRKDLYFPSMISEPRCRTCCRLQYKQPNRKARSVTRIINKSHISSDDKYMLMKKLQINMHDIKNYLSDYKGI